MKATVAAILATGVRMAEVKPPEGDEYHGPDWIEGPDGEQQITQNDDGDNVWAVEDAAGELYVWPAGNLSREDEQILRDAGFEWVPDTYVQNTVYRSHL